MLRATVTQSTARISAIGPQTTFSQRLGDAKLTIALIAVMQAKNQVPHRKRRVSLARAQKPARPSTTNAAHVHTTTEITLPIRWPVESSADWPPHAAWPRGAPAASAAWKIAMMPNPIVATTAARRAVRRRGANRLIPVLEHNLGPATIVRASLSAIACLALKRARGSADTSTDMVLRRPWIAAALGLALGSFGLFLFLVVLGNATGGRVPLLETWLYQLLIVAAALLTAARAVLVREDRLAWAVMAAGLACNALGELYFLAVDPAGFPSLADLGWIAFYPLTYVAIMLMVQRRARSFAGTLWLDGVTAAVTAAAFGSAVLVEVVLRTLEGSRGAIATNLAYPLGDVLLLSAVFGVFSLAGWRLDRRWLILGLGLLATAIADGIYLFEVDTYQQGGLVDILWPLSSLLIAFAAWVDSSDERGFEIDGRPLLAVPVACAVVAIGILAVDHFAGVNVLAVGLATGSLLLVLLRLAVTFRENGRLFTLTRQEAVTDMLTGLGNRRRLVADLDAVFDLSPGRSSLLMLLDLDGFKGYNDSFGHPAGDALLTRLAEKLATVAGPHGGAYRLGGDEFCLLVRVSDGEAEGVIDGACGALVEHGEGFHVSSSFGAVLLPAEAADASHALSLADERLYAQKRSRRDAPATRSSTRSRTTSRGRSPTGTAWLPWRSRWGVGSRSLPTSSTSSPPWRSSTTSASSRCRTRSSPSLARWTSGSGSSSIATRSSASGSSGRRRPSGRSRRWFGRATRTGTARGIRTRSPASRYHAWPGSSGPAPRSWRWPRTVRTGAHCPSRRRSRRSSAAPGHSSTRTSHGSSSLTCASNSRRAAPPEVRPERAQRAGCRPGRHRGCRNAIDRPGHEAGRFRDVPADGGLPRA